MTEGEKIIETRERGREKRKVVEKARYADRSGRTGVTQTITWLFLAAGARPFIFHAPAVAVCGDAFLDSRAHTWNTSIHLALNLNGNVIASLLKVGSIVSSLSVYLSLSPRPLHE